MKVRTLGFQLALSDGVALGELFQQLESVEDKEIKISSKKGLIYTDVVNGLICGLILSYKSNKKSLVTQRDKDGDLKVTKNELKDNEHGTEVSIFCLNPGSLKGLFYSYSGGVSATGMSDILKQSHDAVFRRAKEQYRKEITEFGKTPINHINQKIENKFKGFFDFKLLVTPSDLNTLLSMYSEITKIELNSSNALADSGMFTPLEDVAKGSSIRVNFDRGSKADNIKSIVKSVFQPFAKQQKETILRLYGMSHLGQELSLRVGENSEDFGRSDYDDFVDNLPKEKWKDYKISIALENLIRIIKETEVVFGNIPDTTSWKLLSAKDINERNIQKVE
jgi:hypothetical protein